MGMKAALLKGRGGLGISSFILVCEKRYIRQEPVRCDKHPRAGTPLSSRGHAPSQDGESSNDWKNPSARAVGSFRLCLIRCHELHPFPADELAQAGSSCPASAPNGTGHQMRVLRWIGHGTGTCFLSVPLCRSCVKSPSGVRAVRRAEQADPTLARGDV